eukprot:5598816-Pleurochrysis_carterae.AAC.3
MHPNLQFFTGRLCAVGIRAVTKDQIVSACGKLLCNGKADPASAASDYGSAGVLCTGGLSAQQAPCTTRIGLAICGATQRGARDHMLIERHPTPMSGTNLGSTGLIGLTSARNRHERWCCEGVAHREAERDGDDKQTACAGGRCLIRMPTIATDGSGLHRAGRVRAVSWSCCRRHRSGPRGARDELRASPARRMMILMKYN